MRGKRPRVGVAAALLCCRHAPCCRGAVDERRLQDRRAVAAGTRAYSFGFQDGRFYANGWHITGEMGGVWAPPLKLADGIWFGVDDDWVGPATKFTSGRGFIRYAYRDRRPADAAHRLRARRHPRRVVRVPGRQPDRRAREVTVKVDVHSELMGVYPWFFFTPPAASATCPTSRRSRRAR